MLQDRGEAVRPPPSPVEAILAQQPVLSGDVTDVYFSPEDRVGVKFARTISANPERKVICISFDGPTPFTKRECDGVQFFLAKSLYTNRMRHCLVPSHRKVSGEGLDVDHLPKILETDMVVQYHAWAVGTVVRIERVMGGGEPAPYFRVVSASN